MNASLFLSIAGVGLSVSAVGAALLAVRAARQWRVRCESLESSFAGLRRELQMVASISARTGRRVQRVEHEYSDVAERVDWVETRSSTSSKSGSLDLAIDSARQGADSEKLTQSFGISRGEADLVARLHGRQKSA
jgi:hypothetical protein